MGPLHWSSLLNSERGLGKMILTGPGFGDFELFCSVSGMVELFMQRWGLAASFTFFRESSISRMPFCGFEAEDTSFDGCGCRSKNKKGCRTTATVFCRTAPSNCGNKNILLTFTLFFGLNSGSLKKLVANSRSRESIHLRSWKPEVIMIDRTEILS